MIKTISRFTIAALSCAMAFILASCDSGNSENTFYFDGFYTITGSNPNYKLIEDNGTIIYPTAESVYSLTNNQGFGSHRRIYIQAQYHQDGISIENGVTSVRNVTLSSISYLLESNPVSTAEAAKANINVEDSIFSIQTMQNCWVTNGYLTTIFYAPASYNPTDKTLSTLINPTTNLLVETDSIADDYLVLSLLYNRHTKKDVSSTICTFGHSFDISGLSIPGSSDSLTVKMKAQGMDSGTFRIARKQLVRSY